jgi:phosphatidate phosphatase APP1
MPEANIAKTTKHLGVRLEDSWHAFRERNARGRGMAVNVLPSRGYGLAGADDGWVRVFARIVLAPNGAFDNGELDARIVSDGVRGWRNFIASPIPFAEVVATVGGQEFTVDADRGGVLDARIPASLTPGWHSITLRCEDSEPSVAEVFVVDGDVDFGLLSDIDDTVMVTALPRPFLAAWNSFVLDEHARAATPGMAVMMERLMRARSASPVLYLSTGAWNVAPTLTRFLSRNLYPDGALLLTDWGPTEGRWFRSGMKHKVDQLRRLASEFPTMRWLLVGDDGQHDPEIYAEFAKRYPQNVRAIVIRQLTPSEAVLAGGRSQGTVDSTPGVPWVYATDGAQIIAELEKLGLVEADERRTGEPG